MMRGGDGGGVKIMKWILIVSIIKQKLQAAAAAEAGVIRAIKCN